MAHADPWRPVRVACWDWLEDLSPLGQRLWFWLSTGPDSRQTGLILLREYRAAGALRTNVTALRGAVRELSDAGRLTVGKAGGGAVPLYMRGWWGWQCGRKDADRLALRSECLAFVDASLSAQAVEELEVWSRGCGQPDLRLGGRLDAASTQQKQEKKQEQEQKKEDLSLPSVAAPAALPFPLTMPEEHKPKEPHPKQLEAIEKDRKAKIVAKAWDEIMVSQPAIGRPSASEWKTMKTVLANALDYSEGEATLRAVLHFANKDEYLSGRQNDSGSKDGLAFFARRNWSTVGQRWANVTPLEPTKKPAPPKPTPTICPVCHRERPQGEKVTDDWGCLACLGDPDGPDQTLVQETDDETP